LNDVIQGGGGADIINGGVGNDIITGGAGADKMTGGTGSDTFHYNNLTEGGATESVTDFDVANPGLGGDKLDISALLDLTGNSWADGGTFADAVSGGYITFSDNGGKVQVNVDVNGGGDSTSAVCIVRG
jgi:Ca2+-binding RTX toxin-like protein